MGILRETYTAKRFRKLVEYNQDTGKFIFRKNNRDGKKGDVLGKIGFRGYEIIELEGIAFRAHRLVWLYMTGAWPSDEVDHRDRDRTNNRFSNLRAVTRFQNCQNVVRVPRKNHSTGLLGASLDKATGLYASAITLHWKVFYLGRFVTKEEAHERYLAARKLLHPFSDPEHSTNPQFVDFIKRGKQTQFNHPKPAVSKEAELASAEKKLKRAFGKTQERYNIMSAHEKALIALLISNRLDRIDIGKWRCAIPALKALLLSD